MEKRPLLVLVSVIAVFVFSIIGASWFAQGRKGKPRLPARSSAPAARRLLLWQTDEAPRLFAPDTPGNDLLDAAMAAGTTAPQELPSTDAALQEAINNLSPATGAEHLNDLLRRLDNLKEASRIYNALGALYIQMDPPDLIQAERALTAARATAQAPVDRDRAAHSLARFYADRGEPEKALAQVEAALEHGGAASPEGFQVRVLEGRLHEQQNRPDLAETAYKTAAREALDGAESYGQAALDVYRQACLALAQLYRKTAREADAAALARTMKTQLRRIEKEASASP